MINLLKGFTVHVNVALHERQEELRTLGAFIGRGFNENDEPIWRMIQKHLSSLKNIGFEWEDAESTQAKPISDKVKEKIDKNDIFIGILTKREPISKIHCSWKRTKYNISETIDWLTSYWVIQESGYAIGKGKKVFFLIEKGLNVPQALNADHEYIEIDRENPSLSFTRISELINSEIGKKLVRQESSESVESIELRSDVEKPREKSNDIEDKEDQRISESFIEMFGAIRGKEFGKAEECFKRLSENIEDGKKLRLETAYYKATYMEGKAESLPKLQKLANEYPEDSFAVGSLVDCYNLHDEHDKSINELKGILDRVESLKYKIEYSALLADIYIKQKEYDAAISIVTPFFSSEINKTDGDNFLLYKTLGDIYKAKGDLKLSCPLYDFALKYNASDYDIRFSVAYDYSVADYHMLSLYHYQLHQRTSESSMGDNNIGVEYERLNLHGKSIKKFQDSSKKGNTLASSNLARHLIDCGFTDEAKEILKQAQTQDEYHKHVDSHLQRLKQKVENENDMEKSLLERALELKEHMHSYAKAIADKNTAIDKIVGSWQTGFKNIREFRIELKAPNILTGSHEYDDLAYYGGLPAYNAAQHMKRISINGTILNRGIQYSIKIEHPMTQSILGGLDAELKGFGSLVSG